MNGTVLLTVLLVVGSGELKRTVTHSTESAFHPVLAGFILGTLLYIIGLANAGFAEKLCYLFIAFALIANGGVIITAANTNKTAKVTK